MVTAELCDTCGTSPVWGRVAAQASGPGSWPVPGQQEEDDNRGAHTGGALGDQDESRTQKQTEPNHRAARSLPNVPEPQPRQQLTALIKWSAKAALDKSDNQQAMIIVLFKKNY